MAEFSNIRPARGIARRWRAQARIGALAILLVSIALVHATAPALARKDDPSRRIIVHRTDSTLVMGTAIALSKEIVQIDPDGAGSIQEIPAASVSYIVFASTGRTMALSELEDATPGAAIPATIPPPTRHVAVPRNGTEFRNVHLDLGAGAATPGGGLGSNYYEGFKSGRNLQGGVRVMIPSGNPAGSRTFVGLTYGNSRLRSTLPDLVEIDTFGDSIRVRFDDLTVHRFGLELGMTTPRYGLGSFLYAVTGLTLLHHVGSVEARVVSGGSSGQSSVAEVTDNRFGFRLGLGGVYEPLPRWGLELRGDADVMFGKSAGSASSFGTPANVSGSLMGVTLGIVREL